MFRHGLAKDIKSTRYNRKRPERLRISLRHIKHLQTGVETPGYNLVRRFPVALLEPCPEALDNYAVSFRLEHRRSSN